MNKKRIFALLLATLTLLSGCGAEPLTQTHAIASAEEIRFSWWGNDARHIYTMDAVSEFEKLNPDIDVTCNYGVWSGYERRTKVYMNSETEADVMQINYAWIDTYSPDGEGYYDLNQLSEWFDFSAYASEDLEYGMKNGKLNAIPIAFNTLSVFYSKELYDQYKLEIPKNWEDLFAAAKVMSEDDIYPLGMAKKQMCLLLMSYYTQQTGKDFFTENGRLNVTKDEMVMLLEFYKKLQDEKVIMPVDTWGRGDLTTGKCAGAVMWVSDTENYCGCIVDGGFTPVLGEYPGVQESKSGKCGWYIKPATMYAVSNSTEHPEQAARLLDFLLNSPEMAKAQKLEKGIPISKKAVETLKEENLLNGYSYEAHLKMLSERDVMEVILPIMENESVINTIKSVSDEYLYDKAGVEEVAEELIRQLNEISNKNR